MTHDDPTADSTRVRFERGERAWVVPPQIVLEVSRHRRRSPVPGAAPGVVGASSIRGIVVPLFDLDTRLGRGRPPNKGQQLVFVGTSTPLFGLVADRCEPVSGPRPVTPIPDDHPWAADPLVSGQWPDGTLVLRADVLLVDPRLHAADTPLLTPQQS